MTMSLRPLLQNQLDRLKSFDDGQQRQTAGVLCCKLAFSVVINRADRNSMVLEKGKGAEGDVHYPFINSIPYTFVPWKTDASMTVPTDQNWKATGSPNANKAKAIAIAVRLAQSMVPERRNQTEGFGNVFGLNGFSGAKYVADASCGYLP